MLGTRANARGCGGMALYHFDTWNNGRLMREEIGVELDSFDRAKSEAARSLVDLARDILPDSTDRMLAVEVREGAGPILRVALRFRIVAVQER
jgi:hypothetical protein